MTVTSSLEQDYFKLYFQDNLHLSIYVGDLVGVQCWVESESWYCVDYYFKDTTIHCQYDNLELWQQVLKQVDQHL